MKHTAILLDDQPTYKMVTLHRSAEKNTLSASLISEINHVFDLAEEDANCKMVILQGEDNIFCTGMDFKELTSSQENISEQTLTEQNKNYLNLLKRFSTSPIITVSIVNGQTIAGGVGLVAASDYVIANQHAQFSLSEALWGFLPAMVLPFLIRRVGFQVAYRMTLTTQTITPEKALEYNLVDELSDNYHDALRRLVLRLNRLQKETVEHLKSYFRKMWIISEEMEQLAIAETAKLVSQPQVVNNIRNFVEKQIFPWEQT